ncbi:chloramphenicol phosphotransferase CPT family protein [Burkholderia arboris]|uniref:chloramphenicol phosphotransferase CPT family protein n=1 Tax=Burkholderia arboris TaxID=488730 RepID=UPI00158AE27C|nr:AAA family ATPase [Burkholderia arboris]
MTQVFASVRNSTAMPGRYPSGRLTDVRLSLRRARCAHPAISSSFEMKPVAIVLHGPTSAGKSSLARALQDSSDVPVFHVSLDAFAEMSRRRDMRSDEELGQALRLHHLNLQSTLSRIAASHFDIVLDLVLRDTSVLDACIAALSPRRTIVVGVSCPLAILEQRERARPDRGEGMARSQFGHPAYSRPYSMRIDTSTCSPEEGARRIRAHVDEQGA